MPEESHLASLILTHKQAYYYGQPTISDAEYDALEDKLRELNPANPALSIVGAPIPADNILRTLKHHVSMHSQLKARDLNERLAWYRPLETETIYHGSFKADGLSIELIYRDGKLDQAITRGDGEAGEDVTANAMRFKGVPALIKDSGVVSIRGEGILTLKDWKNTGTKNPRNGAAGIARRKNGQDAGLITFLAFDYTSDQTLLTELEVFDKIGQLGFITPPAFLGTSDQIEEWFRSVALSRPTIPYWIDGCVIRLNSRELQVEAGYNSDGRPRGQIAFKFDADGGSGTLLQVDWQVGSTGQLTPVGKTTPILIGGTSTTSVMLNNVDFIKGLGVKIGSKLEVVKAGDIIPYPVSADGGDEAIVTPTSCPVCSAPTKFREDVDGDEGVVLCCTNYDCPDQQLRRLAKFTSSFNLLGFGDGVLRALLVDGQLRSPSDLYSLKPESLENIRTISETGKEIRVGRSRAEALINEVQTKARSMTVAKLLGSLSILGLDERRAIIMTEKQPTLKAIGAWTSGMLGVTEFAASAGVPKLGAVIDRGIATNLALIATLLDLVQLVEDEPKAAAPVAGGKTFCITGTLPSGRKKAFYAEPLAAKGHQLVDDVKKGLDYLVVADPTVESNKTKKAKSYGVTIIGESEMESFTE